MPSVTAEKTSGMTTILMASMKAVPIGCSEAPSDGQAEPTMRPRMSPASIWSGNDRTDLLTGASMLVTAFLLLRLSFWSAGPRPKLDGFRGLDRGSRDD